MTIFNSYVSLPEGKSRCVRHVSVMFLSEITSCSPCFQLPTAQCASESPPVSRPAVDLVLSSVGHWRAM